MKRLLTIIMLIAISAQAFAQRGGAPNWISIAGKAGIGGSNFMCKQLTDNEDFSLNYLSPAFSAGGRLGVVFVDRVGVSVEYLSSNFQNKAEFNPHIAGEASINSNLKLKSGDLLFLARYTGQYGFYLEIGPKITSIKDVTRDIEGNLGLLQGISASDNVTDKFKGKFNSFVFGFGFSPYNGDRVQITLGLRGSYCGKNVLDVDENVFGFAKKMTGIQDIEMKPLSAQAMVEVCYHFARFGSATCGKQRIIFFK